MEAHCKICWQSAFWKSTIISAHKATLSCFSTIFTTCWLVTVRMAPLRSARWAQLAWYKTVLHWFPARHPLASPVHGQALVAYSYQASQVHCGSCESINRKKKKILKRSFIGIKTAQCRFKSNWKTLSANWSMQSTPRPNIPPAQDTLPVNSYFHGAAFTGEKYQRQPPTWRVDFPSSSATDPQLAERGGGDWRLIRGLDFS